MLDALEKEADKSMTADEVFSAGVTVTLRLILATLKLDPTAGPRIEQEGLYPLIAACNPTTPLGQVPGH